MKLLTHTILYLMLLYPTSAIEDASDIKMLNIKEKITLIDKGLRKILIQKNNIEGKDSIDIKLDDAKTLSVEQSGKSIRIVLSTEKEDGITELLIDGNNDGLPDFKLVYKDGELLKKYQIEFFTKEVKIKSKLQKTEDKK